MQNLRWVWHLFIGQYLKSEADRALDEYLLWLGSGKRPTEDEVTWAGFQ